MKFQTFGDKHNKAVLLIHTLFTSAEFFAPITRMLSNDYFVIVPTLSGHYENSTFVSTADEILQIKAFLSENNVASLYALAGFSLGGNIAYEFFCENAAMIEKAIIDSAPLFNFPSVVKNHYLKSYAKCLQKIKSGRHDAAAELNKYFNGMGEYQKDIAPIVSQESLKSLVGSCFKTKVHALPKAERQKITFVYGGKDIARLCTARLKKYHVRTMKDYGHCGFYRENPVEWAKRFVL